MTEQDFITYLQWNMHDRHSYLIYADWLEESGYVIKSSRIRSLIGILERDNREPTIYTYYLIKSITNEPSRIKGIKCIECGYVFTDLGRVEHKDSNGIECNNHFWPIDGRLW